jgi:hypothetical protein
MAKACYEAYLKAYAEGGNKDCGCVTHAYSNAETTIKKFGEVWAKVEGIVSSSTCVYGALPIAKHVVYLIPCHKNVSNRA